MKSLTQLNEHRQLRLTDTASRQTKGLKEKRTTDLFQESIKKGERDIEEGRVTICKTEEELDNFFISV